MIAKSTVCGFAGVAWVACFAVSPLRGEMVFPENEVKAGAEVVVDLPELGMSASSRGAEPVRARAVFPVDWDRKRQHPVFVQFHGSYGANEIQEPWPEIFGNGGWIFLAVDYPLVNPYPAGMAHARQALEMLRKVAALDENRIVAGGNASGAYSICHCLHGGGGEEFDAFILVCGGTEQGRTASNLGDRPVLVIEAELDTAKRRQTTAKLLAKLAGRENLTHVVVEGMGHTWPPTGHPAKSDGELQGDVMAMVRDWLRENGLAAGEPAELVEMESQALAEKAVVDEKAFRYAAALAGYRELKRSEPGSEAAADAGIARILARRGELLEKAAALRADDPEGANALLERIKEVFGE